MKISIIHPSRGRPVKAVEAYQEWLMKAEGDFEYILSIDQSDPTQSQYYQQCQKHNVHGSILLNPNRCIVEAVNVAAKHSTGDLIVVMSDDFGCPEHWDKLLIERVKQDQQVLHVFDTIQRDIVTLPIMTRSYYNRFGYVYHPQYFSMFCDNDLTECAKRTGAYTDCRDLTFEHRHWVNGKAVKDKTYEREESGWAVGEKLFKRRKLINFGL